MKGEARSVRPFVVAYGVAHCGKSLFWHASELLFAYFLTEACGLPPREMGLILGISLLLNALADLVAGLQLRRWVRTALDAGRIQGLGAILSGAAFVTFGLAGMVAVDSRFAFALTTITLFRLTYTLLDTPQNALLALTTTDDGARARLASVRYIFGGFANILVAGAFAPLLRERTGSVHAIVFAVFSAILALLAVASAGMLWRWLGTHPPPRLATIAPMGAAGAPIRDGPRPRRWPIFLIMFVISAATSVFSRLEPYFVAYGLRSSLDGGALMVCVAGGTLASQPFWSWWAQRHSLVSTLRAAAISLVVGALAFGLGARHGVAPAALSGALYGWGCGGVLMSLWALAAAATRDQDPSGGATATFGALTFSAKVALAFSAFGVGEFLTLSDYRTGANGLLLGVMASAPLTGAVLCLALSAFIFPRHPRQAPATGS